MRKPQPKLANVQQACGISEDRRPKRRTSIALGEFMGWKFSPDENLLGSVFTRGSTGMLAAPRGLGHPRHP